MDTEFRVNENRPFYKGKFWPQGVPHQLEIDPALTISQMLDISVQKFGDNPAIWFLDTMVSYKEFKEYVDRFASALHSMGVKKGDVVGIYLPNSIQYVVSYYAIVSLGAIATGINPTYKALEVLHQVKLTGAHFIIVLDILYKDFLSQIVDQWDFTKVIATNLLDLAFGMPKIKQFLGKALKKVPVANVDHPNAVSFLSCLRTKIGLPTVAINAEKDAATLIMTGGTTGVPKAAELTHRNVVSNSKQAEFFLIMQKNPDNDINLGPLTCMLGVLPLFHSYAHTIVMNAVIATGGWMALFPIPPPVIELFKTVRKLPNLNYFIYPAVEILLQRIAELPQKEIDKFKINEYLKICTSSAGPLHDYVREPFEQKTGARITELFGLTEASPGVSANNFYGERVSGTIGVPLPGTDWEIFPADDFNKGPIPISGEEGTGEICVCGPQVMKGYWQNPERTADTIKEWDGRKWLLTGDIGFIDENGRITIRDRKKQLIKMAGHSVFPAEVESLIGEHPDVLEVAVAGLPDTKTGEAVKAWVVVKPNSQGKVTKEDILGWCKENLTYWKCPKYIEIIGDIPKNAIGKVMRRSLQEADPLFRSEL